MRRLATTCLTALALSMLPVVVIATPAEAHNGAGVTTMGNRLEGENYSTPDSACDPDGDGEHTSNTNPSGTVFMPHSGCGVNFGTVNFQYPGSFGSFRADTWSGTGETVTSRVEIVVDGSVQASGSITRAPGAGYATVNFSSANAIAAGNHTVRLQYTVTTGPYWSNLRLDYADFDTVMTQVGSKQSGTGCTQPTSSTNYDIRDSGITHWLYFHVAHTPLDIKRTWVNDDTGVNWGDDIQTHTGATGDWCWEYVKAINGTFFQPRPGNWHVETYFKTVSGTWARVAPNLSFQVWPKRTGGGVYKTTQGDGITTFGSNDVARVYTNWSTTYAINHTVRYKWYRPDGTEHTAADSGSISLPAGQSSYQTWGWMDIAASGASAYPGTWTVKTWIDDTNYMEQVHTLTISSTPSGPANDNYANAASISAGFNQSVSNTNATLETSEPRPCANIGTTVWYRFTPSGNGSVTVDTTQFGSYDTVLAAYTGSSLSSLSNVACNDDYSGTLSQITFNVTGGTTYYIQLGTYGGAAGGSATLRLTYTATPTAPSAPQNPAVTAPAAGQLRVSWTAPASSGSSAITKYRIYGGTTTPLGFLAEVPATQLYYVDTGLQPGTRTYQVTAVNALEGPASTSVTARAYADYTIEIKAWIPHATVVDPIPVYLGYQYDPVYAADFSSGYRACWNSWYFYAQNPTWVTGTFDGDNHATWDAGPTSRVSSRMTLRWDGATVTNVAKTTGHGTTVQRRNYSYYGAAGEDCELARATAGDTPDGYQVNSTSVYLGYSSKNPRTTQYPFGDSQTPAIDGSVTATFDSNGVWLSFNVDQFPTHAIRVTKNGGVQATVMATDASCVDGTSVTKLKDGLNSSHSTAVYVGYTESNNNSHTWQSSQC